MLKTRLNQSDLGGWHLYRVLNKVLCLVVMGEILLTIFTGKVSEFHFSRLNGQRLGLPSNVNYVSVILDPKLNSRLNIELRNRKACIVVYACKRAFVTKWNYGSRYVNRQF